MRHRGANATDRRDEVQIHERQEFFRGGLDDLTTRRTPGAVDQHVQAAEFLDRSLKQAVHVVLGSNVGGNREDRPAGRPKRSGGGLQQLEIPRGQNNPQSAPASAAASALPRPPEPPVITATLSAQYDIGEVTAKNRRGLNSREPMTALDPVGRGQKTLFRSCAVPNKLVHCHRLNLGCHWLCQCSSLLNDQGKNSKDHWQSQWHTIQESSVDKALVGHRRTHLAL